MRRIELTVEEINERRQLLKGLAQTTVPEALNVLSIILPGPLGVIVPTLGNIYLNFKEGQSTQERENVIKKLNSKFEKLPNERDKKIVLNEIEKACEKYLDDINKRGFISSEIFSVDTITIVLRDEEYIQESLCALQELIEDNNSLVYAFADNPFFIAKNIIVNLLEPQRKSQIESLVDEMVAAIDGACDMNWNRTAVKVIYFD